MKPEQIKTEFELLTAVPAEESFDSLDASDTLIAAKNEAGARLESLFGRMDQIAGATEALAEDGYYTGPSFRLLGPEITLDEYGEDTQYYMKKARAATFELPIDGALFGRTSALRNDYTRTVHIGYSRFETFIGEAEGERRLEDVDWDIESITTLDGGDLDGERTDEVLNNFTVVERTNSRINLFYPDCLEPESETAPFEAAYVSGLYFDRAAEVCDRRLEITPGLEILDSLDIAALEAAVSEIEQTIAALQLTT
jgi:hypothetical protein